MNKVLSKIAAALITVSLIVSLLTACAIVLPSQAAQEDEVEVPEITARGAILYCVDTDEVIYEKNADTRYRPYSITKLMTALLVAENMDMDQEITVSKKAYDEGGSSMNLKEGEVCTVEELLYGTLILSGNDAAYALAESYTGDIDDFLDMMNDRAEALGCTNTHFNDPNGLSEKNHYTTARDFLLIAKESFANEKVSEVSGTKKHITPPTNKSGKRVMESHLDFIYDDVGVYKGKTGYWDSGHCSIAAAYKKDDLDLIIVLLDSQDGERRNDAKKLYDYAHKVVPKVTAVEKGEVVGDVLVRGGETLHLDAAASRTYNAYTKIGQEASVKTKFIPDKGLTAPIKKGDKIGKIRIKANGETDEIDAVAVGDMKEGWFLSKIYITKYVAQLIGAVLLLLLVLYMTVYKSLTKESRKKKKSIKKEEKKRKKTAKRTAKYADPDDKHNKRETGSRHDKSAERIERGRAKRAERKRNAK